MKRHCRRSNILLLQSVITARLRWKGLRKPWHGTRNGRARELKYYWVWIFTGRLVRVHSLSSDDSRRIHEIQQGREFLSHKRHALTSTTTAVLLQPNGRRTREVFPGAPRTHSCTRTRISSATRYDIDGPRAAMHWLSRLQPLVSRMSLSNARASPISNHPWNAGSSLPVPSLGRTAKLLKLFPYTCVVLVLSLSNLPKSDKSV